MWLVCHLLPALLVAGRTVHGEIQFAVFFEDFASFLHLHRSIQNASRDRWCRPDGLVLADHVVVQEMDSNHRCVVLYLLGEAIGQACGPPHVHSHREVLALNMAGADLIFVHVPNDCFLHDLGNDLMPLLILSVDLDQPPVVHIVLKRSTDRGDTGAVSVRAELNAVGKA